MKYYAEVLHPHENKVLWHYYLEAPDEETAKEAINKQVLAEHSGGFLLDTGGLFMITVEEDKRDENGKWPKNYKTFKFEGEEVNKLLKIALAMISECKTSEHPEFLVVMGGIGSGKTTLRRNQFKQNYVNIDYEEVLKAIEKVFGKIEAEKLFRYGVFVCQSALRSAIDGKFNIVIEIIGASDTQINPILEKMKAIGYEIKIEAIITDPSESYKRHLDAVKNDPTYFSAFYTEGPTMEMFYSYFNLGPLPKRDYPIKNKTSDV